MHGAIGVAKKNFRRAGIPATIKGNANPDYRQYLPRLPIDLSGLSPDEVARIERVATSKVKPEALPQEPEQPEGPTKFRVEKSSGSFTVGDDKRGTRIYHFHDSSLDRMYSRIARQAKSRRDEDLARAEYAALLKYRHHWHASGLEAAPKSVDLDRIFCADASNMSGMPRSERQAFHRQMHRDAAEIVGHASSILLDNFVCYEWSPHIASAMSPYLFRKTLREAARKLARHWGM